MLVESSSFRLPKLPAFIVIDGVNGAGKSTLQRNMLDFFSQKKREAMGTREPGATAVGKKVREMVMSSNEDRMSDTTELLLFAADRAEHVAKVIKPALAKGISVICDRYYYSTYAFQGFGRKIDLESVNFINKLAINGAIPDLTIILDLEPEIGIRRNSATQGRGAKMENDSFEHERDDFQQRMRSGFLDAAKTFPEPFILVDASKPPLEVFFDVKGILERSFY